MPASSYPDALARGTNLALAAFMNGITETWVSGFMRDKKDLQNI
jgi:hypothetical protein